MTKISFSGLVSFTVASRRLFGKSVNQGAFYTVVFVCRQPLSCHPAVLHFAAHAPADRKTALNTNNALTVRPNPGLAGLKRAENLLRITAEILGKSVVPARNRTDEHGRKQGYWVELDVDDDVHNVQEGTYKDGKPHGHWILRCVHPFGDSVEEGPFVNGKRHGQWVERCSTCTEDTVEEGSFVDGKKHGRWVVRYSHGDLSEGPYVEGWRHGHWVERSADGGVFEGVYVDGEMHGLWVLREANGDVTETCYENGDEVKP